MSGLELLVDLLNGLPHRVVIVAIAMIPFAELRGAIPIALGAYGMGIWEAYVLAVIGNLIPVVPLLLLLGPIEQRLRRFKVFDWFFDGLFKRTRHRVGGKIKTYGALGLIPFVAIPLPVTGAWTGVAAAYIFGIGFKYAFAAIALGVMIAGAVVTLASIGVIHLWFL